MKFGYSGTLARIADTLRGEREQLNWIPDGMYRKTSNHR